MRIENYEFALEKRLGHSSPRFALTVDVHMQQCIDSEGGHGLLKGIKSYL